ncbi:unnamed protein product [Mytilus edulis]|uniref:C-type lectin domain-containing protein n=1 Tax=Mytilus edulis TaxID=6550 RepID=A0A8S3UAI7_MYTED|nr:unnamed protein product [Mytilus edulis]
MLLPDISYAIFVLIFLVKKSLQHTDGFHVVTGLPPGNEYLIAEKEITRSKIDCANWCAMTATCMSAVFNSTAMHCGLYRESQSANSSSSLEKQLILQRDCPSEWMRFGNSCYFYENRRKLPWDNATEYCVSQGGYLAEVTDEAEFQMVDSVINEIIKENELVVFFLTFSPPSMSQRFIKIGNVFIGCRLYNEKWQWITSGRELLLNDTLWTPGEPFGGSTCLQIWKKKGKKFDDTGCNKLLNFLCEKVSEFNF